ncbi:MBL fold metallo-hydrolase [Yoonia sp. BS5-3]|uniref:MBL fold metallo-hydrolase n=1 Tax=Yoonia phaeophyticola TaxID=3137369 RepID=A0ABZ2V3C1_9RHOB
MTDTLEFTILGCGSSGGVPRLGGLWGACDPNNPKNIRRRCSLLVTRRSGAGVTQVLIDTGPDMRSQLLDAGVGALDAVVYTHAHADHMHGIDDLRMIVFNTRTRLAVWADEPTSHDLLDRFGYAFVQPEGSSYPPICDLNRIDGDVLVDGAGGAITLTPFEVEHGAITALGFRVGDVAYLPDVSAIPQQSWGHLQGLDCWIVDALRHAPHPTHSHLANTLEWIEQVKPKQAVLTNMHNDLDYAEVAAQTPEYVQPAYDGMTLSFPAK